MTLFLLLLNFLCNAAEVPTSKIQNFKFYKHFIENAVLFEKLTKYSSETGLDWPPLNNFAAHADTAITNLNKKCNAENVLTFMKFKAGVMLALLEGEHSLYTHSIFQRNNNYFALVQPYLRREWQSLSQTEQYDFSTNLLEKYSSHKFEYTKYINNDPSQVTIFCEQFLMHFAGSYAMIEALHRVATSETIYKADDHIEENGGCTIL